MTTAQEGLPVEHDPKSTRASDGQGSSLGHRRAQRSETFSTTGEDARSEGVRSARFARTAHGDVDERGEPRPTVEPRPSATPSSPELAPASISISVSIEPSFCTEVIERFSVDAPPRCYRDAVRLPGGCALLVIVDLVGGAAIDPRMRARWKRIIGASGAGSLEPDEVLRVLNGELFDAGVKATASCAVLDARDDLLSFSSAGASSAWLVRAGARFVRVQHAPSVELGAVKGAAFAVRRLHFGARDTFILPSAAWAQALDATFAGAPPAAERPAEWLRAQATQPEGGCVLCLSVA